MEKKQKNLKNYYRMKTITSWKLCIMLFTIFSIATSCSKNKDPEPTPQPVEVKTITITELRNLGTSASVKLPDGRKVKGIVISDASGKNIDSKSMVIQEATEKSGIIVTFDTDHNFALGDEVEITISNQTLAQVSGELVLQNIPAANAKKTGTGTINARETTIAEINTNKTSWNGTLVSINATELVSSTGKFNGTMTVTDASGTISSKVLTGAAFEDTNLPASVSSITGIVRQIDNQVFIQIRKSAEVVSGDISQIVTLDLSKDVYVVDFYGYLSNNIPSFDAGFTTNSKSYIYAFDGNKNADFNAVITNQGTVKAEVKTITVTFAGSKIVGDFSGSAINEIFPGAGISQFNLAAFDASKDYYQIELLAYQYDTPKSLNKISASFKENGKFFKVTFKAPTQTELTAAGVDNDFKTNPAYGIRNISKRTIIEKEFYSKTYAPILIEKIELGY